MPKLPTAAARVVAKAESGGGYTLVPEDDYRLKLLSVKVSPKPDRNDNHYWIWQFEIVGGDYAGSKQRTNTWWTEEQAWWMKAVFEAFGAKANVDTDTLVGKEVMATITQREIESGPRQGKITNDISSIRPVSEGDDDDSDFGDGSGDDDPDF